MLELPQNMHRRIAMPISEMAFGVMLSSIKIFRLVCNGTQWCAMWCKDRAKRIVLSTKKALVVGGESH